MKKTTLSFLLSIILLSCFGQKEKQSNTPSSFTKIDIGLQGIGINIEPKLTNKITMDLAAGAGGGYNVGEESLVYEWNIFQPAFYFSITPKFFYNMSKRIEKGLNTKLNSGNYIGVRIKYVTPSIAPNDMLQSTLLLNLHWGIQRAFGKRWFFNPHIGGGYALDINSHFGTIYPTIDFKFSYILSKLKN